jgi:hypothetical protein
MNENQARTAANIMMAAAALGAAVFILRNPKLRRMAWQLARQYATGPLAVWSTATVRNAWDASGAITSRAIVAEQGSPTARIGPVA